MNSKEEVGAITSLPDNPNINVVCPHCNNKYVISGLFNYLLKQELNYHLYGCPMCKEVVKIDPFEYLWVSKNVKSGALSDGVVMGSFKPNELTLAQKEALKNSGILTRIRAYISGFR